MKSTLLAILMMFSSTSMADGWHHTWGWVTPVLIGGVVGYTISKATEPKVIVYPQPLPPQPVQSSPLPQQIYQKTLMWETSCGCYREILIKIQ